MANFVQDQKSFIFGETSLNVMADLGTSYSKSVSKLVNYDVNRDGSIQPRKAFEEVTEVPENQGFEFFKDELFYIDNFTVYRKADPNIEITFTSTLFPTPVRPIKLKAIGDLLYVFFEDGIPFIIEEQNNTFIVYPFYSNQGNEERVPKMVEKFPFTKAPENLTLIIQSEVVGEGTSNSCFVYLEKNGTRVTDLTPYLNTPIICNLPFNKAEQELISVVTQGVLNPEGGRVETGRSVRSKVLTTPRFRNLWQTKGFSVATEVNSPKPRIKKGYTNIVQTFDPDDNDPDRLIQDIDNQQQFLNNLKSFYYYYAGRVTIDQLMWTVTPDFNTNLLPSIDYVTEDYIRIVLNEPLEVNDEVINNPIDFVTATYRTLKEGSSIDQQFVFQYFQALSDRFLMLYPHNINGNKLDSYLISFGVDMQRLTDANNKFSFKVDINDDTTINNFFFSAFGNNKYPINAEEVNNKTIFQSKKGTVTLSKTEDPTVLSNPIKLLYNSRTLNLSYGGAKYTGGRLEYYNWKIEDDYYKDFLSLIENEEDSFAVNINDPQTFELKSPSGDLLSIRHLNLYPIYESPRIIVSADSGVYYGDLVRLLSQGLGFSRVSEFKISKTIKPFIAQNTFFFVDETNTNLFQSYLDNSNNTRFVFEEASNECLRKFDVLMEVKKIDELKALIKDINNKVGIINIYPKKLIGLREIDMSNHVFITFYNGCYVFMNSDTEALFITQESNSEFSEFEENFYAECSLYPFTISNYYPAQGIDLDRVIKSAFVFKKKAINLEIGINNINYKRISEYQRGQIVDEDIQKVKFLIGSLRQNDNISLRQKNTDLGTVYGLSFSGSFTEYD